MKLLNYTSKYFVLLLLPLLTIWAVVFYYALLDEIYDSLDDGLDNQKLLLLQRLETNPSVLEHTDLTEWNHSITPISEATYANFKPSFRDTLIYMQNEQDFEPVRVHESVFKHKDEHYKVKLITSMVEEDDLIVDSVRYLIILYVLLIFAIVFVNNLMLKQIWKPFHNLIGQLRNFKIEGTNMIQPKPTSIEEFQLLNKTVLGLISTSKERFIEQKHFIENAAHELQTPLAISINKLELFLENNDLNEQQLSSLASVMDNLNQLARLNKSLLLLSKIENQQFVDDEPVDFNELTKKIINDFDDFKSHRNIEIEVEEVSKLMFSMNMDLANILLVNLIKNAIVHGTANGKVKISIASDSFSISNTGKSESLDNALIFSRFKKMNSDKKSTGLGLAIVKAIVDRYHLSIDYSYNEQHNFFLKFPNIS